MTPFDMSRKPSKQYFFLMPLIWLAAFIDTRKFGLKIDKTGIKGLKPPYLVIATHQGPADYSAGPLAMFPHRAIYVSDMEGFENYGKWLYRGLGCIGKRRFVSDINVVKNIRYALSIGQSVVIYPEARHSNAGITAYIPKNLGKLCKLLNVPVVIFHLKGAYLANPFWDEAHTRKVPMEGRIYQLFSVDQVRELPKEKIQKSIEEALQYNEYEYQIEKKIRIDHPRRSRGINNILYICRKCGTKYAMLSDYDSLGCLECNSIYTLKENGYLQDIDTNKIYSISKWYEWERKQEINDLKPRFKMTFPVTVEALPNEKGFVYLGDAQLTLNEKEFVLNLATGKIRFPHKIRESVQTEYNYKGHGKCIVLSTKDCCYYLYNESLGFNPTQLQFIGEYLYQKANGLLKG